MLRYSVLSLLMVGSSVCAMNDPQMPVRITCYRYQPVVCEISDEYRADLKQEVIRLQAETDVKAFRLEQLQVQELRRNHRLLREENQVIERAERVAFASVPIVKITEDIGIFVDPLIRHYNDLMRELALLDEKLAAYGE